MASKDAEIKKSANESITIAIGNGASYRKSDGDFAINESGSGLGSGNGVVVEEINEMDMDETAPSSVEWRLHCKRLREGRPSGTSQVSRSMGSAISAAFSSRSVDAFVEMDARVGAQLQIELAGAHVYGVPHARRTGRSTSVNPPVEEPISRQTLPAASIANWR